MAPQQAITALFVVLSVIAVAHAQSGSNANDVYVTVPFGSDGIPSDSPALAGFKDKVLKAFTDSLQYIKTTQNIGPAASAPAVPLSPVPIWTYDSASATQSATVIFTYPAAWSSAIMYLMSNPLILYNNGEEPGRQLQLVYDAIPTPTISFAAPPPPTSAPPPPIFGRPNPSPAPTPVPVPSSLPNNTWVNNVTLYNNQIPTDDAGRKIFEATYLASFANAMTNVTNGTAGQFPATPTFYQFSYTLVPDNVATGTSSGRRSLLQDSAPVTAPSGQTWQVLVVSFYTGIPGLFIITFAAQATTVTGQTVTTVAAALVYNNVLLAIVAATVVVQPDGTVTISAPTVGYGGTTSGTGRRRMIERKAAKETKQGVSSWASAEPADIAYGTDKALYEVFTTPVDYYAAGAACAARGAKLASYASEGAQVFIDILCDGAPGSQCWVEGNSAGSCTSVKSSALRQLSCARTMPFVCIKDQRKALPTTPVMEEYLKEMALAKPADTAFDSRRVQYELFATPVDYFTAGSICLARGGRLANYNSEASQVFVDVLCEGASGQSCWVEGANAGKCSTVRASDVIPTACTKLQQFVCAKGPSTKSA